MDVSSLSVSAWPWRAPHHRKGSPVAPRPTKLAVRRPLAGSSGAVKGHLQAGRPGHTHRSSDSTGTSGDPSASGENAASDGADGGDARSAVASSSGPGL